MRLVAVHCVAGRSDPSRSSEFGPRKLVVTSRRSPVRFPFVWSRQAFLATVSRHEEGLWQDGGTQRCSQAQRKGIAICPRDETTSPPQWSWGRVPTLRLGRCGFDPQLGHTKDYQNGTHCFSARHSVFRIEFGKLDHPMIHRCWSLLLLGHIWRRYFTSFGMWQ